MANLDEIRKKKLAEESMSLISELEPLPESQEEQMEPVQIEREPASKAYDMGGYEDVVATGAGPLLALLGGASPAVFNMHMDKANASAKIIGDEAKVTKDKITVLENDEGQPYNELVKNSVGKKPYYQSKLAGIAKNLGETVSGNPIRMYNPLTSERAVVQQYKDGTAYKYGTKDQIVDIGSWQPDLGVATASGTDVYGTKSTILFDKNKPSVKKPVKSTAGYGTLDGVPEKTRKGVDKITEKYVKDTDLLEVKKNDLTSAVNILKKKGASPTELTAAREAIIRSVTSETRLTDEDVQRAMGDDFREIVDQVFSKIGNKAFGEMSKEQREDFLIGAETLIKRLENGLNFAYNKSKQRANALPAGKDYFESQTPDRTNKDSTSKEELKKIEREAVKRYGLGTDRYNKFMQFQRSKLGM